MFTWLLLLLPCAFVSADGPTDGHGTTQSISVTGAGTDAVNGIYFLAAANPAHSWVETGLDYYVLREATDGSQACLIDLYYNKDTSAWKISLNGHEQYSSSGIFATWSVANNGQEPPPQVSRSPVYVTGAGTAAVNGEYQPSVPNAAHTWVDPAKEYYMLKAATDGNQAGLFDLYYNKDTSGWKISSNGHEQYSSQEIFGSWSALQGQDPPPSVSGPSRTSVSCGSTTSNPSSVTSSTTSSSLSTVFLAFVPLTAAAAWVEVW